MVISDYMVRSLMGTIFFHNGMLTLPTMIGVHNKNEVITN